MTLGDYIQLLEQHHPDQRIPRGLNHPHSWRGSYDELAFQPCGETTVAEMLRVAKSCVGYTFQGWKGGDYTMGLETPINIEYEGEYTDGDTMMGFLFQLMIPTQTLYRS